MPRLKIGRLCSCLNSTFLEEFHLDQTGQLVCSTTMSERSSAALGFFVRREARIDLQLFQRYVITCSERRPGVEEAQFDFILAKDEVHKRGHRRLELTLAPLLRDAGIGKHFVPKCR